MKRIYSYGMTRSLRFFVFVVLVLVFLMSCGGRRSVDDTTSPSVLVEDPQAIASLEGYSARLVPEPVFGGEVYVVEAGPVDGPPIVLVHGLGRGGASDWYGLIPALATKHRVVAFDLPGFSRSTKTNALYSPARYVEFIKWAADKIIGDKFDLVGHSMGATIALKYAGTHGGDVKRLILADAAGILDRHVLVGFMAEHNLAGPKLVTHKLGGVLGWVAPIFMELSEDFTPDLHLVLESERSREQWLNGDSGRIAALALILENMSVEIEAVSSPTLLIWGREDSIAPLRTGEVLEQRMQNARLEVLDGIGHVPMKELPVRFEKLVTDFLQTPIDAPETPAKQSIEWSSSRIEKCRGKDDAVFTGDFAELNLKGCENATVRDARIRKLIVKSSTVLIERSVIDGDSAGLETKSSELRMTGGYIKGRIAIRVDDSVLDLAGVSIKFQDAAVKSDGGSKLVLSVCIAKSEDKVDHLHGLYSLQAGDCSATISSGR